ncbi:stage II sporulation protein M [Haloarculaceae archaeon H-GB2-1]|nr:stage II sporulation protein M [Haloarculaceae archaeon H-GB1-1]MEA5386236.1 stage II sporulation protein M [Haloarculaceae archaeon H-GB11]MEA5407737.1 stage II sporulation protein M [Haloarculaceae archaeon H-GB2-1]
MLSSIAALHRRARFRRWFGVHLAVAVAVFVAGVLLGVGIVEAIPLATLAEWAAGAESPLPDRITFWTIFTNNVRAMALMFLGSITLGVLSLFGLFLNGVILGFVGNAALARTSPLVFAALVVPHGIIELPALFVAGALGLRVAHRIARWLLAYDDRPLTSVEAYELVVLLTVLTVAIAVAAYIEATYTLAIADRVGDVPR